ncbi:MAG TPA: efflux RND transporter periplasmic adaptor subunit [Steroidobacteraceae bacterium]|jgi:RND family efflux transporter MFP subunit|nr:efflux RND transporter periplasmic adaptor subunit [Steroidobacteraceae bacterium]
MSEQPADHPNLGRLKRFALYVLIVAVIIAAWGILARISARAALKSEAEEAAVAVVEVVQPRHSDGASNELVLPGDLQAYSDAPIYARTNGYLKRWYADIGKHVKAGELLAEIETPEVDAQYRQAKADLASAQANNRLSQTTAARFRELRKTGLVAQQDADNAEGDADAKAAQVESAQQNLDRLQQLESFNHIVAPFDGVITVRRIDVGSLITQGNTTAQELFHLSSTSRLRVYVQVPQAYASVIRPGMQAWLSTSERPDERHPVKVLSTAQAIDAATRTLLTELAADNPRGELLPGSYSQVHLPLPVGVDRWRVPATSLLYRGDGLHLAVVDAHSHVHLHSVTIGKDYGAEIEILSGIEGQDRVIQSPPDSILEGAQVKVVGGN